MDKPNRYITQTLLYSDMFDFPLTKEELWRYLGGRISRNVFEKSLSNFPTAKGFYCLPKRQRVIERRLGTEKTNKEKKAFAFHIANTLRYIPTISLIGLSGSVAIESAEKNDDVDLFVIAKTNTVWITRLLCLLVLHMMGVRRKRGSKDEANTACLNMLIDENNMVFEKNRYDIYTAHEIAQMIPLYNKGNTYEQYLYANKWIVRFFPNIKIPQASDHRKIDSKGWIMVLDHMVQFLQLQYMKKHKTTEITKSGFIAFHPFDYRTEVLKKWEKIQKIYGI